MSKNYGGLKGTHDEVGLTNWDATETQHMLNVFLATAHKHDTGNEMALPGKLKADGKLSNGKTTHSIEASVTGTHYVLQKYLQVHLGGNYQAPEQIVPNGDIAAHQHHVAATTVANMQRLMGFIDPQQMNLNADELRLIGAAGKPISANAYEGAAQQDAVEMRQIRGKIEAALKAQPDIKHATADQVIESIQKKQIVDGQFGRASKTAWAAFAHKDGEGYRLAENMPAPDIAPDPRAGIPALSGTRAEVARKLLLQQTAVIPAIPVLPGPVVDSLPHPAAAPKPYSAAMAKSAQRLGEAFGAAVRYDADKGDFKLQVPDGIKLDRTTTPPTHQPREMDPQGYRDAFVWKLQHPADSLTTQYFNNLNAQGKTATSIEPSEYILKKDEASKIGPATEAAGQPGKYEFSLPASVGSEEFIGKLQRPQQMNASVGLSSDLQSLKVLTPSASIAKAEGAKTQFLAANWASKVSYPFGADF